MKLDKSYVLTAVGAFVLGKYGKEILGSKEAKQKYAKATAVALRVKDDVMDECNVIRAEAEDIYAEAVEINEQMKSETETVEVFTDLADVKVD